MQLTRQHDEHRNSDADGVINIAHDCADPRTPAQEKDEGVLVYSLGKLDEQGFGRVHRKLVVSVSLQELLHSPKRQPMCCGRPEV